MDEIVRTTLEEWLRNPKPQTLPEHHGNQHTGPVVSHDRSSSRVADLVAEIGGTVGDCAQIIDDTSCAGRRARAQVAQALTRVAENLVLIADIIRATMREATP